MKKVLYFIAALISIALVLFSCTNLSLEKNFEIRKNIVYKKIEGVELTGDLYLPKTHGLRPVVLVLHGGGWAKKSGDMEYISQSLANEGFVVFNANYRLAPENKFPKAPEDVKDALLWIKNNSELYSIDSKKIATWGYSAGAHLALLAALDGELGVKAIVAGGTPTDLTVWPNSKLVIDFLGSQYEENPELWRQASPVNHVTDLSPPVFMYHGEWDTIVAHDQMEKLKLALLAKEREVETYTVSYIGHLAVYLFSNESVNRGINFIKRSTQLE